MTDVTSESFTGKAINNSVGALAGAFLAWLFGGFGSALGSGLLALLAVLGGLFGLISTVIYRRYVGVLAAGGMGKTSPEKQAYDALRQSLSGGGLVARLYTRWLTRFLDGIDRFFGDASLINQQVLTRAFGMKTPAPLWTAPAYDRCMLLAAIYPLTTIMVIWTVSGHVGPAEAVLRLRPDLPGWWRALQVGAVALEVIAIWKVMKTTGWRSVGWGITCGALAVATSVSLAGAVAVGGAFLLAGVAAAACAAISARFRTMEFQTVLSGAGAVTGIVIGTFAIAVAGVLNIAFGAVVAGFVAVTIAGALTIANDSFMRTSRQGVFLSVLSILLGFGCIAIVWVAAPLNTWGKAGPMILFLGLLPLLNAPFDWASIGLTRALLRRGLEQSSWWPLVYAFLDAVLAVVIIVALALVTVVATQTFNAMTVYAGRKPILSLQRLFDGIAAQPAAPEYWWVYALLLSTMVPSLINLMIGGASLMRGLPILSDLVVRHMPANKAVPAFNRASIALVLTAQTVGGAILGIMAQTALGIGLIFFAMPWLGLGLLDLCRWLASFDVPSHVWHLVK